MKTVILRAALAAALLAGALPVAAQTELKLGHVGEPGSLIGAAADHFAELANARLGGKYKIVTYGSSQLGGDKQMMQKLKLGTIDMVEPSTIMSSIADMFGVFEMPYLVKSREHMKKIGEQVFWSKIEPSAEKKGYKVLGLWENGFRQITNNKRPIVTPADLEGIKLRTPEGKWRVKMFQAYGANPSPMKFSEVFTALQTGVMDGQENPLSQIYSAKFYEVQKYLSMTGHVYTPAYLIMSTNGWNKLPPDVQKVIMDAAKETQDYVYQQGAKMDEDLLQKMKAAGIKVNEADKDAFIKASRSVYEEFAKEVPGAKEVIDRCIALGK
ncbi:MAG TPA: TRAP transporter substrate-binding protein [Usitatibacter sp.]|jgi:tripartite ATP-independent transporter DctP family solute receptor|nr:TRAP transporter substrate-binding protein [Usitatibacter sp.]